MNKEMIFWMIGCTIGALLLYALHLKEDRGLYAENDTPIPAIYRSYQNLKADYKSDIFEVQEVYYDGYQTRLYQAVEPKAVARHVQTNFYYSPFGFALYSPQARVMYIIRKKVA